MPGSRKPTNFPVVPLPEAVRAAWARQLGRRKRPRTSSGYRILSISYDPVLLRTRELLLREEGHLVTSAGDRAEAIERCSGHRFDLVVLGHSIPGDDKQALIRRMRELCETPVLSMVTAGEPAPEDTDFLFQTAEGPKAFLDRVAGILHGLKRKRRSGD